LIEEIGDGFKDTIFRKVSNALEKISNDSVKVSNALEKVSNAPKKVSSAFEKYLPLFEEEVCLKIDFIRHMDFQKMNSCK
jgi:hypothetical protein